MIFNEHVKEHYNNLFYKKLEFFNM